MNSVADPGRFDIVARIAGCVPALRPAGREVAALILADLAGAARASIGELAQRAGVSVALVTRFAKAVGCADVRELKLRLAQAAAVGERFLRGGETAGASVADRHGARDAAPEALATRTRVFDEIHTTLARHHELLREAPLADARAAPPGQGEAAAF